MEKVYIAVLGIVIFLIGASFLFDTMQYKHGNSRRRSLIKKMIGITLIIATPLVYSGRLALFVLSWQLGLVFFILGLIALYQENGENLALDRSECCYDRDTEIKRNSNDKTFTGVVYLLLLAIVIVIPEMLILGAIVIFLTGACLILFEDIISKKISYEIPRIIIGVVLVIISALPYIK